MTFGLRGGWSGALGLVMLGLAACWPGPVNAVQAAQSTQEPMPLSDVRGNSKQPIDITADRLELDRKSGVATFSGNVHVTQADVTLEAQTLKVYYGDDDGDSASGPAIKRIEASGAVVFTAPGETARGDHAVYDVSNRVANLSGDVVLTRRESVLKGGRLTIDFAAGHSHMEGAAGNAGRVHGVFVPQGRNNDSSLARGER